MNQQNPDHGKFNRTNNPNSSTTEAAAGKKKRTGEIIMEGKVQIKRDLRDMSIDYNV